MKTFAGVLAGFALTLMLASPAAAQQSFPPGSVIIPMEIDNQDTGMRRWEP